MKNLRDFTYNELQEDLSKNGISQKFRSEQVYRWLHQHHVSQYDQMCNIPHSVKNNLKENYHLGNFSTEEVKISEDGTLKFLFGLNDREVVETVWIPAKKRRTLCISSQVGCAMGCRFCSSGAMGLVRNLSAGEIVNQLSEVLKHPDVDKITHIVFMGIGEPLQNLRQVMRAVDTITHEKAFGISASRITISTVGLVPAIKRLASYPYNVKLAVSLHSSFQDKRESIMPMAEHFSLTELMKACDFYTAKTGKTITFEYIMLKGINDTQDNIVKLAALLRKRRCKVNLIPFNETPDSPYEPSSSSTLQRFQKGLESKGVSVTLRTPRGRDIVAACGQLRHISQQNKAV
ncbi:23S rRNA (adenine(2503)-C(2))-methyltransferase [PVC group bacterium (ex Bugula neritina AB1)]|nr:23S rRNA (adenine(2503)-C(2))-methyltransferase [PVC group bacterium (ex Bugula neritina AB1)]